MNTATDRSAAASFLNPVCLDALSAQAFQHRRPYPWVSTPDILTGAGYEQLRATLPDVSLFEKHESRQRSHGQGYHDRYILHYRPSVPLADPWRAFLNEIQGKNYDAFVRRMFGIKPGRKLILTMEWYYGWRGCAVSPHCDARRKVGTHIFYFNTEADWKDDWGGNILIMDDDEKWKPHSAPTFDDLKVSESIDPRGNSSLLFARTDHSWHGVRPLEPPPGPLRKLFIVTINTLTWQVLFRRLRGKDPDGYPIAKAA
jgi:hypothetical protein